jgi:hypothetical protein
LCRYQAADRTVERLRAKPLVYSPPAETGVDRHHRPEKHDGVTGMLVRLRTISGRWDTPQTPWWRWHEYGFVLLGWLVAAGAVVYSLISWSLAPLPLFLIAFSGASLGATLRHRWDVQRDRS